MINLSGATIGSQDYIVEHKVPFRELRQDIMDTQFSCFAFGCRSVFGLFYNNKGNNNQDENNAYYQPINYFIKRPENAFVNMSALCY